MALRPDSKFGIPPLYGELLRRPVTMAPPLRKNATSVYRFRNGFLYFPHSPPPPKKKLIFCWKRGRFEIAKKSLLDAEWASFKFLINRLLFEPRRRLIVNVCGPEHPYRCKRNISDLFLKKPYFHLRTKRIPRLWVCGDGCEQHATYGRLFEAHPLEKKGTTN